MALAIADAYERFHSLTVDRDVLLAAGLLQDASKLIEMEPGDDGTAVKSEIGARYPHAFWGSHVALEHGLPHAVCAIILDHTPQSPRFPASLEGKILHYADQLDIIAVYKDRWDKKLYITMGGEARIGAC
jgi:HD superfamily phosphodiesterase